MTFAIWTYWLILSGVLEQHNKKHPTAKAGKVSKYLIY